MQNPLQQHSHSLSILIVDDSDNERALLRTRLQHIGHQITEATNGHRALDYLADHRHQFDLIILDVLMPGFDGFKTAQGIRELEKKQTEEWRPIIFLSGKSTPKDIAKGIEAGGDDYLEKPVDARVLKAKIQAMQRIADMRKRLLEMKQTLEAQAHTDELTKLPNRRCFLTILDSEIARARRHHTPLSIAYMDLDHFKRINDTYGHEAGDAVLRAVSSALTRNLRAEDYIGRHGGEEFCICLPNTSNSTKPCERYRSIIESLTIDIGSHNLGVTASFGVTSFNPLSDDRASLLARADKALYQAKHSGRNCVGILPCPTTP